MAVLDQPVTMFANNRHVLHWAGLTEEGDPLAPLDLTGRIVKFALTALSSKTGSPLLTPKFSFSSADLSPQVVINDALNGEVTVELLPADTALLAPTERQYYGELEVYESDLSDPVVVATMLITIKPNVTND